MTPFHLKIVTPDGLIFDGQAEELIVRTTGGDVAILARHMDYVAPLGMGRATVVSGGQRRNAAYEKADSVLKNPASSQNDLKLAEAKLRRALVRKSVASSK